MLWALVNLRQAVSRDQGKFDNREPRMSGNGRVHAGRRLLRSIKPKSIVSAIVPEVLGKRLLDGHAEKGEQAYGHQ